MHELESLFSQQHGHTASRGGVREVYHIVVVAQGTAELFHLCRAHLLQQIDVESRAAEDGGDRRITRAPRHRLLAVE